MASGPSVTDMSDVVELNGILYISGYHELEGDSIERFNIAQSRWQSALDIPVTTTGIHCLATDGTDLYVGTEDAGVLQMSVATATGPGGLIQSWDTSAGLSANEVIDIEHDVFTDQMIAIHPFSGMSVIDTNSTIVNETWTTNTGGLASNQMNSLAVRGGIAYLGTNNRGVERIDIANSTRLTPWTSTGLDDLESMPIAIDGDTLYLGLYGFGVIVYNVSSGEQIDVWQRTGGPGGGGNNQIPSNNVLSLAVLSSGTVLVGTDNGGARHTSNGWTNMGSSGNEFADEF